MAAIAVAVLPYLVDKEAVTYRIAVCSLIARGDRKPLDRCTGRIVDPLRDALECSGREFGHRCRQRFGNLLDAGESGQRTRVEL